MSYMYDFFFVLQIMAYFQLYHFDKPINAQIFIESLLKIVEFETLSPEPIIQLWDQDFTIEKFLLNNSEEGSWLNDNYIFVFFIAVYLVAIILAGLLMISDDLREKIRDFL